MIFSELLVLTMIQLYGKFDQNRIVIFREKRNHRKNLGSREILSKFEIKNYTIFVKLALNEEK